MKKAPLHETPLHDSANSNSATLNVSRADLALAEATGQPPLPWEEIDVGRFMPRRICGSFRGRVLG